MATIVLVEKSDNPPSSEFIDLLENMGHNVVKRLDAKTLEDVTPLNPDLVVSAKDWAGVGKKKLLEDAFNTGISVFSWGNDTSAKDIPKLIESSEKTSAEAGTVATVKDSITKGMEKIPNSDGDYRAGITEATNGTEILAIDQKLGYYELLYREEWFGNHRWLHYQPSKIPPKKLMSNTISYMSRPKSETPKVLKGVGVTVATAGGGYLVGKWLNWW